MRLQQLQLVESVIAMDYQAMILTGRDVPENVNEIGLISTGFNDLGLPALLGRGIEPSDSIQGRDPQSVGMSPSFCWRVARPGGRSLPSARHWERSAAAWLKLPEIEDRPPTELSIPKLADSWLSIIGIVGDSRNDGLRNPIRPAIYVPYTLHMAMGTQILIRTRVSPLSLVHAVREQVSEVNPDQQVYGNMDLQ